MRREWETDKCNIIFYMYEYCFIWYFYAIFHCAFKNHEYCVILIMEFTWVTCDRVNDCRACRGLDIQYCINTLLALAASFIWESHICPRVRFVLRAVILSNWTFNQSWNIENIPIITKDFVLSVVDGPHRISPLLRLLWRILTCSYITRPQVRVLFRRSFQNFWIRNNFSQSGQ